MGRGWRRGRHVIKWVHLEPDAAAQSVAPPTLPPLGEVRDHRPKAPVAVQRRQVRRALREGEQLPQVRQIHLLDCEFLTRPPVGSPCGDFIHGLCQDLREPGRIGDVRNVLHHENHGESLVRASSADTTFCSGHAVVARGGVDVAAAEKEPIGSVGRVLAGGGVGKAVGAVGGGRGEGREEGVEVGIVGGVGSEETTVWARKIEISDGSCSTEILDEDEEEEGGREGEGDDVARIHDLLEFVN
ncbi:hypothetical protein EUGRSUZ_E04181 [Eucalyptus grandis]|uniref:Uncharacterized protein n=2 Tax=Eucalyptus grandis TaxID=71139 RepID=A0ACC3KZP9_EUCGR|nr:hypothetical protein EUGRSUZ_E04181 [Eucalyptus grandis]